MSFPEACARAETDSVAKALEETWGHLKPEPHHSYPGRFVWAQGCHNSEITFLVIEFEQLDNSPWLQEILSDFVCSLDTRCPVPPRDGCVCEWAGTLRNGKLKGSIRLLLDACVVNPAP